MSLKSGYFQALVLTGLFIWGLISSYQGMGLSFFVSGIHQGRDEFFIASLYLSVILAVVIALFSPRAGAIVSLGIGITLLIMVFAVGDFHEDATIAREFVWAIIWRPFLAAVFLFPLPPVGPLGRSILRKGKPSVSQPSVSQ